MTQNVAKTKKWTRGRLVRATLRHYWRTNLAIVAGVVIGTAVIGGALIVGDSVRASLRQMTLDRLAGIDEILTGHRFVTEQLVGKIQAELGTTSDRQLAPALVMMGSIVRESKDSTRRAGQVMVYGVDERAWQLIDTTGEQPPTTDLAMLNETLATALDAQPGDEVTLWLELPSAVPRDTLLGKRDNDASEITLKVGTVLPDAPGPARLGLLPTQQLPSNVFVNLKTLQAALDMEEVQPTRREPIGQPGRVNTLLSGHPASRNSSPVMSTTTPAEAKQLTAALQRSWSLADLNLRIVHDEVLNVLSVESEQMLLENRLADAVFQYAERRKLPASPVMVYLANWLKNGDDPQALSMYSTVAGLDLLDVDDAFGPFEFDGPAPDTFGPGDVILNRFLADDLKVQVGDSIRFAYHTVGSHGELPEIEQTATVRGILKMEGAAIDRHLTPDVKGITDADSLDDWDQPFPMNLDAVTARDDDYWSEYRATPKAYFPLAYAQQLWPNRYGTYTSVRVGLASGESVEEARQQLTAALLESLTPDEVGLAFVPVRLQGLQAAQGANDFTGLFIGFSLFLILAAVILVGLLFRLAVEQRIRQQGLLLAAGLTVRQVRGQMLQEGAWLVILGGAIGAVAAVGYAQLMLYGLKTWWIGAIGTRFLILSIQPLSVAIGVLAAGLTSFLSIGWSLWRLQQVSIREQLAGVAERIGGPDAVSQRRALRKFAVSGGLAVLLVLGVLTGAIPAQEAFFGLSWPVVIFFVAGLLGLAAGLWGLSAWLQSGDGLTIHGRGVPALGRLGFRNAARRRQRSVLTAGLIATAAFLISAVAAGHKNPTAVQPDLNSGNGGFVLVAESSSPILYDLSTPEGRKTLNLKGRNPQEEQLLAEMQVISFRVRPGEDASCLNLFQTSTPKLLGVPQSMEQRGGFKFVGGGANPWKSLEETPVSGAIPVFGDMNTLMFSLKKSPGKTLPVQASSGNTVELLISRMFDGAIFQGVLLMSERNFLELFPERKGYQYFLIDVPPQQATLAAELLETELAEYGFDTEPVAERLARFLAVQNTYLSTFQSLGGLGLLLGTFGLATVMLRNVLERQAELALMRAVGYQPAQLAVVVLSETAFLLGWGLAVGTISALLAMLPHLTTTGADVPWVSGFWLLFAVTLFGMLAASWAVAAAIRVPIVSTLRSE